MFLLFGSSVFFAFMIAFMMNTIVIHQNGLFSLFAKIPYLAETKVEVLVNATLTDVFIVFRTFKHGMFHGFLIALFFAFPLIGHSTIFERRSVKYIAITAGYWLISLPLIGGIICAWS